MGETLKGKNLLPEEQTLSFKCLSSSDTDSLSREANRKSWKLFPLAKMLENMVDNQAMLNIIYYIIIYFRLLVMLHQ